MRTRLTIAVLFLLLIQQGHAAQLGPRPYFLVDDMDAGPLKEQLRQCSDGPFVRSDFVIGHRGAPLQFPEHTRESYIAASRMGAGVLECDVTFTRDRELVCRHSQCDLHTTTNILAIPELAVKCSVPFKPAVLNDAGNVVSKATAQCCTSDITLADFRRLQGKMDAANSKAQSVSEYLDGTAGWRTDLYAGKGTLLTHAESIELFKSLGARMTPELKAPAVDMPYQGDYTQQDYAQQLINEYKAANVPASHVWPQSFNLDDIEYWIASAPDFGQQAVYLDGRYSRRGFDHTRPSTYKPSMRALVDRGVKVLAPPLWMLVASKNGEIVPSVYAKEARAAGLQLIAWTLERSGPLSTGGAWYYQTIKDLTNNDGDALQLLDVLAKDVGVIGVFADWPATVTYYANCMGLGLRPDDK